MLTKTLTEIPSVMVSESAYDLAVESAIKSVDESLSHMPIDSQTELAYELLSDLAVELPNADASFALCRVQ